MSASTKKPDRSTKNKKAKPKVFLNFLKDIGLRAKDINALQKALGALHQA